MDTVHTLRLSIDWSLMQANAYKGYRYLDNAFSEFDTLGYWERHYQ